MVQGTVPFSAINRVSPISVCVPHVTQHARHLARNSLSSSSALERVQTERSHKSGHRKQRNSLFEMSGEWKVVSVPKYRHQMPLSRVVWQYSPGFRSLATVSNGGKR